MARSKVDDTRAYCNLLKNRSEYYSPDHNGCRPDFDNSLCWEETIADTVIRQQCPFEFCSDCPLSLEERLASRRCQTDGNWSAPVYDQCVHIYFNTSCIARKCHPCPHSFREMVRDVTLALSVLSALTLIASVTLFALLKSIHCRRLTIHAHLASAFILRFVAYTIWIPLHRDQVFYGCGDLVTPEHLWYGNWLCKAILFLIMYATVATTFWMFVEGAYLVSRFTVYAMRATEGPLWLYLVVGWILPLNFVCLWALVLQVQPSSAASICWLPYTSTWALWLLVGPMSAALIVNVLFLIVVIIVLIQKMHTSNSSETAKIWQTIKATLLLVPLLGVSNLLLFYEPSERETLAFQVYMLTTAVLQHSQGIFVAVLYCFANGEVQSALKREVKKYRLSQQMMKKTHRARSYTVVSTSEALAAGALISNNQSPNSAFIEQAKPTNQDEECKAAAIMTNNGFNTSAIETAENCHKHAHGVATTSADLNPSSECPFFWNKNEQSSHIRAVGTRSADMHAPPERAFYSNNGDYSLGNNAKIVERQMSTQ